MMRAFTALLLCAIAGSATAHKPSDSYLTLTALSGEPEVHVQWDIALRDLDLALDLDANRDGAISWGELRTRERELFDYAVAHLTLSADSSACTLRAGDLLADDHSDGAYAVLRFGANCAPGMHRLGVDYRLLFAEAE